MNWKRLKSRIESRIGFIFGLERTPEDSRADFRFIVRFGYGERRQFTNFEAGAAGWFVYVERIKDRLCVRNWRGEGIRWINEKSGRVSDGAQ